MITYSLLNNFSEIVHFCTTRQGGVSKGNYSSFNLSPFTGDNPEHFTQNQQILCDELAIDAERLIIPFQTHGTEIKVIDTAFFQFSPDEKTKYLSGVDALITQLPKVCIGVTTADCVPVLFFDPIKKVIAVAHAGWRGTCGKIAVKTINHLVDKFSCRPSDIRIVIGPSISVEAYKVGEEVVEDFDNAGFNLTEILEIRNNAYFLNLRKANQQVVEKVGILSKHIEISGNCTFNDYEQFFSARRLGITSGRMMSGIMLRD
jgi:hypothetical protein